MTQQAVSSSSSGPPLPLPSSSSSITTPTLNNIDYHPHENHNPCHSPPTSPDPCITTNGPISPTPHLKRFRVRTMDRETRIEGSHSDNEASVSRTLRRRELRGIGRPEHGATHSDYLDSDPTGDRPLQKMQRLNSLKQLSGGAYRGLKTAINGSVKTKRRSSSSESRNAVTENHHKGHSEVAALVRASAYSKDDSHVLRNRTAPSPRVKPHVVNHKVVIDKSS